MLTRMTTKNPYTQDLSEEEILLVAKDLFTGGIPE